MNLRHFDIRNSVPWLRQTCERNKLSKSIFTKKQSDVLMKRCFVQSMFFASIAMNFCETPSVPITSFDTFGVTHYMTSVASRESLFYNLSILRFVKSKRQRCRKDLPSYRSILHLSYFNGSEMMYVNFILCSFVYSGLTDLDEKSDIPRKKFFVLLKKAHYRPYPSSPFRLT